LISSFIFLIGESFKGIWRTRVQSFSSILMIMISISLLVSGYFVYTNFNRYSDELKSSYQMEVFFNSELDSIECRDSYNKIYSFPFIKKGEYISKKRAGDIFYKQFGQDINFVFGTNPLPCSGRYDMVESFRNIDGLNEIKEKISILSRVEDIHYPSEFIIKFDNLSSDLIAGFIIGGIIFLFISIFIISNTIKMVIHARRSQLELLILLGASNIFIKTPLILEGIFHGIIGGLFAGGISILMKTILTYLFYPTISLQIILNSILIFSCLIIGVLFGMIGSIIGIGRYLEK